MSDILSAFMPNRAYRRKMAGSRCSLCGLGITAPDFCLVEVQEYGQQPITRPIHKQCTALLWDMVEQQNEEHVDAAVRTADPAAED